MKLAGSSGISFVRLSIPISEGRGSVKAAMKFAGKQAWSDTPEVLKALETAWDAGVTKVRNIHEYVAFMDEFASPMLAEAVDGAMAFIQPPDLN